MNQHDSWKLKQNKSTVKSNIFMLFDSSNFDESNDDKFANLLNLIIVID